jgi:hypothetical protein
MYVRMCVCVCVFVYLDEGNSRQKIAITLDKLYPLVLKY